MSYNAAGWYVREPLEVTGPNRRGGGFYRTAEGEGKLGGVPLKSAEDAVVAAVRMGYKVAEAQIERSASLAKRLRNAGDRAVGPNSDRQALDATERLVFRSLMAGLGWLESAAAEGGSPLRRLAAAEYRLLGSMFGLTPPEAFKSAVAQSSDGTFERTPVVPTSARAEVPSARNAQTPRRELQIVLQGAVRRPVRVQGWDLAHDSQPGKAGLTFYSAERIDSPEMPASIAITKTTAKLVLTIDRMATSGLWKAAICDADGLQLGFIEIIL